MVQSDDAELMNWGMLVNDRLERKMEDPTFDAVAAMKLLALAYIKEKKALSLTIFSDTVLVLMHQNRFK